MKDIWKLLFSAKKKKKKKTVADCSSIPHRFISCTPCFNLIFPAGYGVPVRYLTVIHGLTF